MVKFFSKNPSQTKKIAESLAKKILKIKKRKRAFVLGLEGELGGGKTTFLQGFAKGLGIKEKVLSPTFIIMKKYELRSTKKRRKKSSELQTSYFRFYHIDCYRLIRNKEILDLGFKEITSNPKNIVTIEWADKIKKIIPKDSTWILFKFVKEKEREISFKGNFLKFFNP